MAGQKILLKKFFYKFGLDGADKVIVNSNDFKKIIKKI